MSDRIIIVGVSGFARSGKDTVCDYAVDHFGYRKVGFSDPIREIAKTIFGFEDEDFVNERKEEINPVWNLSPRFALQKIGTEGSRNVFQDDIWIRCIERKIAKLVEKEDQRKFIIRDLRYENEADFVRSQEGHFGLVLHVLRPSQERIRLSEHPTERGIEIQSAHDIVLENTGTIEDMHKQVGHLLAMINVLAKKT